MSQTKADRLLTGGRIFLGLADGFAEAIALRDGRVMASGSHAELEGLIGPETEVIPA